MRKLLSFLLLLPLGFWTSLATADETLTKLPDRENFHLYLLIGQSNMAGRGNLAGEENEPHPRVLMLTKNGDWAPAVDPLHFDKTTAGVGLGTSFGKAMAEANPGVTIGLIPCAVGGTPLARWMPEKDLYAQAVKRAAPVLKTGTLRGILWHQGEADSKVPETATTYAARLSQMITTLRKDLNAPDVPFVAGELGQFLPKERNGSSLAYWKVVNEQLASLQQSVKNFALVSSADLNHKGDLIHFDSPGLREFGKRYALAMRKLQQPAAETSGESEPSKKDQE